MGLPKHPGPHTLQKKAAAFGGFTRWDSETCKPPVHLFIHSSLMNDEARIKPATVQKSACDTYEWKLKTAGTLRSLPVQVRLLLVLAAAGGAQRGARARQFSSPLLLLAEKTGTLRSLPVQKKAITYEVLTPRCSAKQFISFTYFSKQQRHRSVILMAEKAAKSECGRISKATDVILCSAFWMCNQLSHQTPNQSMDVGTDPVMFFSLE
ncbi:hypothetical protein MJG53_019032 [Ovis ammon polii x Ovis aries]|uniref:Uncharacterized protein n=1 Tax=Ovis ammon polii x Ovis aries TaxID=2918886 RepID=A0ACB9U3N6_9CETA|nr:hypothetical protein MJG53_019032 [Ovis ammon polii x Ovis aries]